MFFGPARLDNHDFNARQNVVADFHVPPIVYDNNVPQTIQVETFTNPISLVVVIQANLSSAAILDSVQLEMPRDIDS